MPFGIGEERWDQAAFSAEQFDRLLKSVVAQINKRAWVFVVYCSKLQYPMVVHGFGKQNFADVTSLTWYKTNQTNEGSAQSWVPSTEELVIGYYGGSKNVPWNNLDPSPMYRHNVLHGPNVAHRLTNDNSMIVNRHEKPTWLARKICSIHGNPGDTVLVLGAGAGGEVVGCLAAGMNVLAFESDASQYPYLKARVEVLAQKFLGSHGNWQKICPDAFLGTVGSPHHAQVKRVEAKDEETQVEPLPEKPVEAPPKQSRSVPARTDLKDCSACGNPVAPEEWVKCPNDQCSMLYHKDCIETVNDTNCRICYFPSQ